MLKIKLELPEQKPDELDCIREMHETSRDLWVAAISEAIERGPEWERKAATQAEQAKAWVNASQQALHALGNPDWTAGSQDALRSLVDAEVIYLAVLYWRRSGQERP